MPSAGSAPPGYDAKMLARDRAGLLNIFQTSAATGAQAIARLLDMREEPRSLSSRYSNQSSSDANPMRTPAGLPCRVMMTSWSSASQRYRTRSWKIVGSADLTGS